MRRKDTNDIGMAILLFSVVITLVIVTVVFVLFADMRPACPEGMVYVPRLGVCIAGAPPLH